MKKYIIIDNDFRCLGYSDYMTEADNEIEYDFSSSNVTLEEFINNITVYQLINNKLILNNVYSSEQNILLKERELNLLKIKREALFKKYIDRSPMFYNSLTSKQKAELEDWYNTWCDMPITFVAGVWEEPELPSFFT